MKNKLDDVMYRIAIVFGLSCIILHVVALVLHFVSDL